MKTETLQPQQVEIETDHYSQQESTPENDPFFYAPKLPKPKLPVYGLYLRAKCES